MCYAAVQVSLGLVFSIALESPSGQPNPMDSGLQNPRFENRNEHWGKEQRTRRWKGQASRWKLEPGNEEQSFKIQRHLCCSCLQPVYGPQESFNVCRAKVAKAQQWESWQQQTLQHSDLAGRRKWNMRERQANFSQVRWRQEMGLSVRNHYTKRKEYYLIL